LQLIDREKPVCAARRLGSTKYFSRRHAGIGKPVELWELVAALGRAAPAWPLAARAQQPERIRRIGALSPLPADDPEAKARMAAFLQELAQFGWVDGRNVRIDARWGAGDTDRIRRYAAELVALATDVILATSTATVAPLQEATRTVPIVFASVIDPVGAGFVASLARPGGNTTGFAIYEYGISGLPDPQGQGSLRPILGVVRRKVAALRGGSFPSRRWVSKWR